MPLKKKEGRRKTVDRRPDAFPQPQTISGRVEIENLSLITRAGMFRNVKFRPVGAKSNERTGKKKFFDNNNNNNSSSILVLEYISLLCSVVVGS
jgi:hypothetical protein